MTVKKKREREGKFWKGLPFHLRPFPLSSSPAAENAGSQTLAKTAWDWCQASYGHDFNLLYPPETMAICLIYGAAQDLNIQVALFMHASEEKFHEAHSSLLLQMKSSEARWWQRCLPRSIQLTETDIHGIRIPWCGWPWC